MPPPKSTGAASCVVRPLNSLAHNTTEHNEERTEPQPIRGYLRVRRVPKANEQV